MERLYLRAYNFNLAVVFEEVMKAVMSKGGRILSPKDDQLHEISNRYEGDKETIITRFGGSFGSYISFVLDGMHYYLQADDNIFFPWKYVKTPVTDNTYSKDACLIELDKNADQTVDAILNDSKSLSEEEAREISKKLLDDLMSLPESEIIIRTHKERVPNIYDNGYHYEVIKERERKGHIDEV